MRIEAGATEIEIDRSHMVTKMDKTTGIERQKKLT
jgi:hypothetical protein